MRHLTTGRTIGGIPFTRGPLAYLLRNRFYIGEVSFKGEVLAHDEMHAYGIQDRVKWQPRPDERLFFQDAEIVKK